ncbi:LysR substrate-binding domain-containing protein [uncultured Paraburkholderia sp.]|uniref:LysR substrate-binding domain-containing protein n=1 Tax=uncultured Paraburkholderia sp. TaxID=1822466 RepID=UPI002595A973|nr:LysR substrate-binding domain-containing protein [uncultured Paraburkholderia sp.]
MHPDLQIQLDRTAKLSLAEQIRASISRTIEAGLLPAGTRLPSWQDLAAQLGVARGTVQAAYERLCDAQMIETFGAGGSRVAPRPRAVTAASVLGVAFMQAMRTRYPEVRLHMVESLSGYLASMLSARQIDLAVLFREEPAQRLSLMPLLDERLFLIGAGELEGMPVGASVRLKNLGRLPLILPSGAHGLRSLLASAFKRAEHEPNIVAEVDGLALLMDFVRSGLGATIQPGAALARPENLVLTSVPVAEKYATRPNMIASISDDELSPAGLAARVVLADVVRRLVQEGRWPGARLREPGSSQKLKTS